MTERDRLLFPSGDCFFETGACFLIQGLLLQSPESREWRGRILSKLEEPSFVEAQIELHQLGNPLLSRPTMSPKPTEMTPEKESLSSDEGAREGWNRLTHALNLLYDEGASLSMYYIEQVIHAACELQLAIGSGTARFVRMADRLVLAEDASERRINLQPKPSSPAISLLMEAQQLNTEEGRQAAIELFVRAQRQIEEFLPERDLSESQEGVDRVGGRWKELFAATIDFLNFPSNSPR